MAAMATAVMQPVGSPSTHPYASSYAQCAYRHGVCVVVAQGLVYWDVFKSARLEALKPRQLTEDELRPKNAKRARVQHTGHIAGKMPKSYSTLTHQESRLLAYAQDFQRVFEELYPHRRPLYLAPRNECGAAKVVCTTLRPTQLNYTELYDLDAAAQFVADYLGYEELEDPLVRPERLN